MAASETLASLEATRWATAALLHNSLGMVVTHGACMADAAVALGMDVQSRGQP